jgi:hypothetical protein
MRRQQKRYKCPVCGTPLTRIAFEKALRLHVAKEKHNEAYLRKLQKRKRGFDKEVRDAEQRGRRGEQGRGKRLMAGAQKEIRSLKERIAHLEKGTTPQTDGLEFEDKLLARLRREFRDDVIELKGKLVGDIVHTVRYEGKEAGKITYECKRTKGIDGDHIRQAYQVKQDCAADFVILVTTGRKRGFTGLMQIGGVLIVGPLGVVPLVGLIRANLVAMLRARLSAVQRARVAQRLLKYVTSPQLKNHIEEVIETSSQLQRMVKEEVKDHVDIWKKRLRHYNRIQWDTTQVQSNFQRILHGKEPKFAAFPKPSMLLPGKIEMREYTV